MKRVTGIGGIFFKSKDPETLRQWYREQLGIESEKWGAVFNWRDNEDPSREGQTAWNPFPADTQYFNPSNAPFMINYRVADLDGLLSALREAGVWVDEKVENSDFGKFGWIMDPEGNRIELWEPPGTESDETAAGE